MVDIVQVVQAARHTTLVTVGIGLAAQIVKVSFFFLLASFLFLAPCVPFTELQRAQLRVLIDSLKITFMTSGKQRPSSNTLAPSYV